MAFIRVHYQTFYAYLYLVLPCNNDCLLPETYQNEFFPNIHCTPAFLEPKPNEPTTSIRDISPPPISSKKLPLAKL